MEKKEVQIREYANNLKRRIHINCNYPRVPIERKELIIKMLIEKYDIPYVEAEAYFF